MRAESKSAGTEAGLARIGLVGDGPAEVVAGHVVNAYARYETVDGRVGVIGDVTLYATSGARAESPATAPNDEVMGMPGIDNTLHELVVAMAHFDAPVETAVVEVPVIVEEVAYPVDEDLRKAA
ncbi:hypothetical protein [Azospirillum sp. sgz302134]